MSDKKKKKKEKVTYIDDGRTIADMSAFSNSKRISSGGKNNTVRPPSTFKDKWNTYWAAVRSMVLPMFITLGIISIVFLIAYLLLGGPQ